MRHAPPAVHLAPLSVAHPAIALAIRLIVQYKHAVLLTPQWNALMAPAEPIPPCVCWPTAALKLHHTSAAVVLVCPRWTNVRPRPHAPPHTPNTAPLVIALRQTRCATQRRYAKTRNTSAAKMVSAVRVVRHGMVAHMTKCYALMVAAAMIWHHVVMVASLANTAASPCS